MGNEAVFKARKRGSEEAPSFGTLGERMHQGGRQHYPLGEVGDLAESMCQGDQPKHEMSKDRPPSLGSLMGQR